MGCTNDLLYTYCIVRLTMHSPDLHICRLPSCPTPQAGWFEPLTCLPLCPSGGNTLSEQSLQTTRCITSKVTSQVFNQETIISVHSSFVARLPISKFRIWILVGACSCPLQLLQYYHQAVRVLLNKGFCFGQISYFSCSKLWWKETLLRA